MCLTSLWCATLKRIILILILHGSSGSSRLNLPDILQRWDRLGWVHHGTHCLHSQTCYGQPLTIGRLSRSQTVGWNSQQRTGLEFSPWVIALGPVNFLLDQQEFDDWKCLVMVHCRLEILFSIFAVGMTNHTPPTKKKKKKSELTFWFVTNSFVRSVTLGSVSVKGQGGKGSGFLALVCACFVSHKLHRPWTV